MPELSCERCQATWTAGVDDLILSGYWPVTLNFATIYEEDLFFTFESLKMASPGMSCQAFLGMLEKRTVRFGRVSISFFIFAASYIFYVLILEVLFLIVLCFCFLFF